MLVEKNFNHAHPSLRYKLMKQFAFVLVAAGVLAVVVLRYLKGKAHNVKSEIPVCSTLGTIHWQPAYKAGFQDRNYVIVTLGKFGTLVRGSVEDIKACDLLHPRHDTIRGNIKCDHSISYYNNYRFKNGDYILCKPNPEAIYDVEYQRMGPNAFKDIDTGKYYSTLETIQKIDEAAKAGLRWRLVLTGNAWVILKVLEDSEVYKRLTDEDHKNMVDVFSPPPSFKLIESRLYEHIRTNKLMRWISSAKPPMILFHIRRGDAIQECDTSLPRVEEYLEKSFATLKENLPSNFPILFYSDELDPTYRGSVISLIRRYGRAIDLDQVLASIIRGMVEEEIIPEGLYNGLFMFAFEVQLFYTIPWKYSLELRRSSCDDFKTMSI